METIFTWISDAFGLSTAAGFGAIGVSLSCLFIVLYILYWLGILLWCFVEDAKVVDKAFKFLLYKKDDDSKKSYHREGDEDWYKVEQTYASYYCPKGSETYVLDSWCGILPPIVITVLSLGWLLLGAIIQGIMLVPVLSSSVLSIFLAVFGARGVRRLQKKLNMHLSDDNAHKEKKDEATT